MALKLKLDADGKVVVQDGKPVYIDDVDNKELALDAGQLMSKITELNNESKNHRLTAKALEEKLLTFGEADPAQLKAIQTAITEIGGLDGLAKLKEKSGVDVEAIKKSMQEAYDGKLQPLQKQLEEKDGTIYKLMVSSQFNSSKFAGEKLILPPDIAEATFGKNFKIEDGKVVAYIGGNRILSRENPGEVAGFDEALAVIVDQYPMKDRILKGTGASGGGAQGGQQGGGAGAKQMSRTEFNTRPPADQMKFMKDGGTVTD